MQKCGWYVDRVHTRRDDSRKEVDKQEILNVPFFNTFHKNMGAVVTHLLAGSRTPSVPVLIESRGREDIQYSTSAQNLLDHEVIVIEIGEVFKEVYQKWMKNFGNEYCKMTVLMSYLRIISTCNTC